MLEQKFKLLAQQYSKDNNLIHKLYQEIKAQHTDTKRHYHNLKHLEQFYAVLTPNQLTSVVEFAIFYHDIIYDVMRDNNEECSAILAQECLSKLNVPQKINQEVYQLIINTKHHTSNNITHLYFLDADLSILGSSPKTYQSYTKAVRKEYAIYDAQSYNEGRIQVLKHFLDKQTIYLTKSFQKSYEQQAQSNLTWELNTLLNQ